MYQPTPGTYQSYPSYTNADICSLIDTKSHLGRRVCPVRANVLLASGLRRLPCHTMSASACVWRGAWLHTVAVAHPFDAQSSQPKTCICNQNCEHMLSMAVYGCQEPVAIALVNMQLHKCHAECTVNHALQDSLSLIAFQLAQVSVDMIKMQFCQGTVRC